MDEMAVDLSTTTPTLGRFHRKLMDRGAAPAWEGFDRSRYEAGLVERARREWAHRAVAEYHSTAQFAQLLHRLTLLGAPIELIGAACRLPVDECRHAELCSRMADLLGGREGHPIRSSGLALYGDVEREHGELLACVLTVLMVCCFGETLSVPMLEAIHVVSTDEVPARVAQIIGADEGYHASFGWEALGWMLPKLSAAQRGVLEAELPASMAHFERTSGAGPKMLERLAGGAVEIERGEPNLGTLELEQYGAIFYHTMEEEILPGLERLGLDARGAWASRLSHRA
jgi:hypothetical protein